MDSDFAQQQYQHHFQNFPHHQKQQMNTLTRFRSAPSTCFASFLDAVDTTITNSNGGGGGGGGGVRDDFAAARPLSPETENIFARFLSSMDDDNTTNINTDTTTPSQELCNLPENTVMQQQPQFMVEVKQETETLQQQQPPPPPQQPPPQQQSNYTTSSQHMAYESHSKPPLARQSNTASTGSSTMGMNCVPPLMRSGGGNNFNTGTGSSGLTRHSSSPAGFLSDILNIDNGFGVMKGMGNYGDGNSRLNFSSNPTTSGLMSQNPDVGTKRLRNSGNNNNDSNYMTGYPISSWDDSNMSENFSSLEQVGGQDDIKTFSELNATENQSKEGRNRPPLLSHHLSLPKTSAELSAMENLLQYQDSVPCRIRAKRGCATHPRSIAERVRRTRISERMRKLQDLVPNMDKQTNTSDMLDLAVEYIKDLQKQVKTLAHNRAKCTCR